MSAPPDDRYRILLVCTGNVCRSPAAELLLRRHTAGLPGLVIGSAGTRPNEGQGILDPMGALLRGRGLDTEHHRARYLDEAAIQGADLILTATRAHRSHVVAMVPSALRRTFTLREFARLGSGVAPGAVAVPDPAATPGGRLRALAALAFRLRGGGVSADLDDIDDPVHRSTATNERVLTEIDEATRTIATLARG